MRPSLPALIALLAVTLTAWPATAADWVVVRGPGPGVGSLTWDRMGQAYLGGRFDWEAVDADDDVPRSASRFFAGAPADHPGVAALLPALGVSVGDGGLVLGGLTVPLGVGLVLVADDPDGAGDVVVFTGLDESSAFEGFRTNIDVAWKGVTYVRGGRRLDPGQLVPFTTDRIDVVSLDALWWSTEAMLADRHVRDRALGLARALRGYDFVYGAALGPSVDLFEWHLDLLSREADAVDGALALGLGHDVSAAARDREALLDGLLGSRSGPRPVVFVLVGDPRGTNARTFGHDPVTGRPAVLLNLAAFDDARALDAALVHELVHTRQDMSGSSLAHQVVREGVASFLTRHIENVPTHTALMWGEEQLAAATSRHGALVDAVLERADATDAAAVSPWITLGVHPPVAGAPDRSGYYVGYEAARAWLAADRDRQPADLLTADALEVLGALR